MQLSAKHQNRFIRMMTSLLMFAALAGCASQSRTEPVANSGQRCEAGTTLVCAHRMGEVVGCSCESKSGLDEIL